MGQNCINVTASSFIQTCEVLTLQTQMFTHTFQRVKLTFPKHVSVWCTHMF
jgi:hypothetical protein